MAKMLGRPDIDMPAPMVILGNGIVVTRGFYFEERMNFAVRIYAAGSDNAVAAAMAGSDGHRQQNSNVACGTLSQTGFSVVGELYPRESTPLPTRR